MEIILMVGISGVGKTILAKSLFPTHNRISLDEIRNRTREYEIIIEFLKQNKNIVIDDTNLTQKIRSHHITLGNKYDAQINALFIDLPMWKIQKNNKTRERSIPESALFHMRNQLEAPTTKEGFNFIQKINENFDLE